jgi:hypothetical protein
MKRILPWLVVALLAAYCAAPAPAASTGPRRVITLNGSWEIAQGAMDAVPPQFDHRVPVPGLVDMAEPPFAEVGVKSARRQAFWYRHRFTINSALPPVALLKIGKAKFGTRVYVNGALVGDHDGCFTPGWFDVRKQLKGGAEQNELVVRVGAFHDVLPPHVPWGRDSEKHTYLPGIYDDVRLILTGTPLIRHVQAVPEIESCTVRVLAEVENPVKAREVRLAYVVRERSGGRVAAQGEVARADTAGFAKVPLDFRVPISGCRPWSPEDPFLYELELQTDGDRRQLRFGMRSFRFDTATGRAVLNGKPYFLRGTNVCIFRFFEDAERRDRPWDRKWVRELHRRFKGMHWNALRYCIGFPPEAWYEIADEEGFLIQDEYPIWKIPNPKAIRPEHLAAEFTEWMQERWNHPCVVIWDAQNETVTGLTGAAIRAVRSLDLSNRPWDNGWSAPQHPDDCIEIHPYRFLEVYRGRYEDSPQGPLATFFKQPSRRGHGPYGHHGPIENWKPGTLFPHAMIINEFGWLWLNRDGSPTRLSQKVYAKFLPPDATADDRRRFYARNLAAMTEYWRSHRQCAGVLDFCGLGHSRPGTPRGKTCDHFVDIGNLTFEPHFAQYVRDAFSPVGLMIDMWDTRLKAGASQSVPVSVINDLSEHWQGKVTLHIEQNGKVISRQAQSCRVEGLGRQTRVFELDIPRQRGNYLLVAEIQPAGRPVRSLRDILVATRAQE